MSEIYSVSLKIDRVPFEKGNASFASSLCIRSDKRAFTLTIDENTTGQLCGGPHGRMRRKINELLLERYIFLADYGMLCE